MYSSVQTVLDFLLMAVIFVSLSYPEEFLLIAATIYGKLVAVIMIILYTSVNNIYGLFVCLLVVYYYQTVYIAELTDTYNNIKESFAELDEIRVEPPENPDISHYDNKSSAIYNLVEYENNKDNLLFDTISNTADNIGASNNYAVNSSSKQKFVDDTCINDNPYYKSFLVRTDMIRHIFPEVKFYKKECNVCDRKCGFTIDDKIAAQEDLQMPNHSGDYQEVAIMDRIKTTAFKSVEYIGLVSDHIFDFI